jgi:hypothetical protein
MTIPFYAAIHFREIACIHVVGHSLKNNRIYRAESRHIRNPPGKFGTLQSTPAAV